MLKYISVLNKRKQKGGVAVIILAMFIIFMAINIITGSIFREAIVEGAETIKTGSDFANLATYKYIDRFTLGSTGEIVFNESDCPKVLSIFKEYLSLNLNLNEDLSPKQDTGLLTKPVSVKKMIIYSVKDGTIESYTYTDSKKVFVKNSSSKKVFTPTKREVTSTSVYTEIEYSVGLMYGLEHTGTAYSYTDITN